MKKAILMTLMVAISSIVTAQKIYKSHKQAPDLEYYYVTGDTSSIFIKGGNHSMSSVVYGWMKDEGFDVSKPTKQYFDSKTSADIKEWGYKSEQNKDAVLTFYKYKERSLVNIKILE
jgi:hypothetical protein